MKSKKNLLRKQIQYFININLKCSNNKNYKQNSHLAYVYYYIMCLQIFLEL